MTATATPDKTNGKPKLTDAERTRLTAAVAAARAEGDQVEAAKVHKAAPKAKAPATPKDVKEHGPQGPEYTHRVVCCHVVGPKGKRCGTVRWCKPQDAFQVKRCDEHTAFYKRERAKARREAKAKAKG